MEDLHEGERIVVIDWKTVSENNLSDHKNVSKESVSLTGDGD